MARDNSWMSCMSKNTQPSVKGGNKKGGNTNSKAMKASPKQMNRRSQ